MKSWLHLTSLNIKLYWNTKEIFKLFTDFPSIIKDRDVHTPSAAVVWALLRVPVSVGKWKDWTVWWNRPPVTMWKPWWRKTTRWGELTWNMESSRNRVGTCFWHPLPAVRNSPRVQKQEGAILQLVLVEVLVTPAPCSVLQNALFLFLFLFM